MSTTKRFVRDNHGSAPQNFAFGAAMVAIAAVAMTSWLDRQVSKPSLQATTPDLARSLASLPKPRQDASVLSWVGQKDATPVGTVRQKAPYLNTLDDPSRGDPFRDSR